MAESMKGLKRTARCAELNESNIGQVVTVMGWVQKNRNTKLERSKSRLSNRA